MSDQTTLAKLHHFKVDSDELKKGLRGLKFACPRQSTLKCLAYCRVHFSHNHLTFSTTNLDMEIAFKVPAQGTSPNHKMLIPFADLVKATGNLAPKSNLTIASQSATTATLSGPMKGGIGSYSADSELMNLKSWIDLPEQAAYTEKISEPLSFSANLMESIIDVSRAASRDDTRYVLNGVFLDISGQTVVGTDGRRLATRPAKIPPLAGVEFSPIIPNMAIDAIKRKDLPFMSGATGRLIFSYGKAKNLRLRRGRFTLYLKFIEGQFPAYHQVIPDDSTSSTTINKRAELIAFIKAAARANKDQSVTISPITGGVEVSCSEMSARFGAYSTGELHTSCFNPSFLADGLDFCQQATLKTKDEMSPITIVDQSGRRYVVMPMRVTNQKDDQKDDQK